MNNILIISILLLLFTSCGRKSFQFPKTTQLDLNEIIAKKGITENLDSLINRRFDTIRTQLQVQLSKREIVKKLEGKWVPEKSTRINGKKSQIFNNITIPLIEKKGSLKPS